jgi:nucleoside-diphosphate-sugar epimerase
VPAPQFTVLGATGFIGSHLVAELKARGHRVFAPPRDADLTATPLGTVFYCIGVTADFRTRPLEAAEAHAGKLLDVLRWAQFDRLVYLSSTRIYHPNRVIAREDDPLSVHPAVPDHLYNISKALGESIALHGGRPCVVARLSNVYGADFASPTFLPSLIRAALRDGVVRLRSALESEKDYVSVRDVADGLIRLATGRERVYNLAGGCNVSHGAITNRLSELTGCRVEVEPGVAATTFPPIDVSRMRSEFGYEPAELADELPALVELYRRNLLCRDVLF